MSLNLTLILLTMLKALATVTISVDHYCDRWWIGIGWAACVELDRGIIHINAGFVHIFDEYQWTKIVIHELAHLKYCGYDESCARKLTRLIDVYCFWSPWRCGLAVEYYCKVYGKVAETLRKNTYIDAYLECMDNAYFRVLSKLLYGPVKDIHEMEMLVALAEYIAWSKIHEIVEYYND